jgi:hypothetical protein
MLFITSCNTEVVKTLDNTDKVLLVKVITYPNMQELNQAHRELGGEILAYGFSRPFMVPCEIHVLDITHLDQHGRFEVWGHELAHCQYGAFHD